MRCRVPAKIQRYGVLAKVLKKPTALWSICSELARHVLHANLQIKRTYCTHNPTPFISGWATAAAGFSHSVGCSLLKGKRSVRGVKRWAAKAGQKGKGSEVCHGITVTDSLHRPVVRGWAPGREWILRRDFLSVCSPGRAFLLPLKIHVQCKLGIQPWGRSVWFMLKQAEDSALYKQKTRTKGLGSFSWKILKYWVQFPAV